MYVVLYLSVLGIPLAPDDGFDWDQAVDERTPKISLSDPMRRPGKGPRPPVIDPVIEDDIVTVFGEQYAAVNVLHWTAVNNEGAGFGYLKAGRRILFALDFLQNLTDSPPRDIGVMHVRGDVMWDTLHHGDAVLVDLRARRISTDGIYVISWANEGDLMVKRVQRNPSTRLVTIKGDNPIYQAWAGVADDAFHVHGRVIWLGRNIGG